MKELKQLINTQICVEIIVRWELAVLKLSVWLGKS